MAHKLGILHLFAAIFAAMSSILVIRFVGKQLFPTKYFVIPPPNFIYSPHKDLNMTPVCFLGRNFYGVTPEESSCFKKTLIYEYNPWVRHHMLLTLEKKAAEKMQMIEEAIATREATINTSMATAAAAAAAAAAAVLLDREMKALEKERERAERARQEAAEAERNKKKKDVKDAKVREAGSVMLAILTFIGLLVTCRDLIREKLKKKEVEEGASSEEGRNQDQTYTLVDYTLNRHMRRESKQQTSGGQLMRQGSIDFTPKVTQTLIHQSSLDRAFPIVTSEASLNLEDSRRNSVPSFLLYNDRTINRNVLGTSTSMVKRVSIDIPSVDMTADTRKKSRHFIRRH